MANAVTQDKEYYLGVSGEQQGPFTEQEVISKIQNQSLPADALVWYEGLDSWLPIDQIPIFQSAAAPPGGSVNAPVNAPAPPAAAPPAPAPPASAPNAIQSPAGAPGPTTPLPDVDADVTPSSFAAGEIGVETVFGKKESRISKLQFWETQKGVILIMSAGIFALGCLIYFITSSPDSILNKRKIARKLPPKITRDGKLRKAVSELVIKSNQSIRVLNELIKQNPNDEVGKQAVQAAVDYFKRNRRYNEAGDILVTAQRPKEAADYYLREPPNFSKAATAYFKAYEIEKNQTEKANLLLQNIKVLIYPLEQKNLAIERLRILEREFPSQSHPFAYYLKSDNERIRDIFGRLTFYFKRMLKKQISTEFPEIRLAGENTVELFRIPNSGEYRIVASYQGPVVLNRDKLENVNLKFWLDRDEWRLVETDLTRQRASWAKNEKQQAQANMNAKAMLSYLESVFKTKFPKRALHEIVASETPPN